ncbi:hypothetical protein HJA83_16515 [Rhizobium bangladeshense]|uniref:hypothetical protein n=1 Tax=Rhizobium sp. MHM7A TaxID=2583233 RepID=UPI0014863C22|nr:MULTISPECIES: hypothetical protein [Rhizobium]MBX4895923.1 hypothetical protein [Rhizobium bangladeshense]MBX4902916.1 hypothetical protein [Rhizobium bangladeshense]MBY3613057.1 hypothetical protein [Rhizobium bangladeshense]
MVPSAPQQATAHIASADDARRYLGRPVDTAAPAHETFENGDWQAALGERGCPFHI